MSASPGRRISFSFLLAASTALFLVPPGQAEAGEPAVVSTVAASRPAPRTQVVIPEAARPMTVTQIAAVHGFTYRDAGTFVLLERPGLRVRVYPGTSIVVVAGREYRVKDPALRNDSEVVLSTRVAGFLNHKISTAGAELATLADQAPRRSSYEPLPPLPPKPVRTHRTPKPQRTLPPKPEPAKPTMTAGAPAWVPPVHERPWKWIVIHHSDDLSGNVAKYDNYHRNEKHWENGCGYHFVIGNGSLSGDGEIEIGPRWPRQLQGAHAKTPDNRYNEYGVGICLVGKFNEPGGRPSAAQLASLARLVRWLSDRYGIDVHNVHGHCDCCSTDCPGKNFPWAELRERIGG